MSEKEKHSSYVIEGYESSVKLPQGFQLSADLQQLVASSYERKPEKSAHAADDGRSVECGQAGQTPRESN